jgi:hypothetical protein
VPGERASGGKGLGEDLLAFLLELQEHRRWQRARQAERDEI